LLLKVEQQNIVRLSTEAIKPALYIQNNWLKIGKYLSLPGKEFAAILAYDKKFTYPRLFSRPAGIFLGFCTLVLSLEALVIGDLCTKS
jgi:hypothetical protein